MDQVISNLKRLECADGLDEVGRRLDESTRKLGRVLAETTKRRG